MRRVLIFSHAYVDPANRGKLRALAARGLELTVGVPQVWRDPANGRPITTAWERHNDVEVFPVPARPVGDVAHARFARRALRALLRDKRPDVIQVEEEPTSAAARQLVALGRHLGVPVVLHTAAAEEHLPLLARWSRRRLLRRLAGVTTGSQGAAAVVRREAPTVPVAVVPRLGVQVPPGAEHVPHEGLAVGYVGRLLPEKGLDTLLRALAENRAHEWHLTVVGDGPDRERLERLASELRLAARVRWSGGLPPERLALLWPDLDVLVLASRGETSLAEHAGQILAEAMAYEVAVIGSGGGVLPEVIGEAGVVVPPNDAPALAMALRRLSVDGVRRPLAQAGRARAMRHYSDDAVAERTVTFWREVLANG